MNPNSNVILQKDGLKRAIYSKLSRGGVFMPKFDCSAITTRNLMKATHNNYFSPLTENIHKLRLIPREPLVRNAQTCYFYLFYLVQVKTLKTLPWGTCVPDYNYIESLLYYFDSEDKLNLRKKLDFTDVDFVFKKSSKKRSKTHKVKRGFSAAIWKKMRRFRSVFKKLQKIQFSLLDNEVDYKYICRLKEKAKLLKSNFVDTTNTRTLIDPILTEFDNIVTAVEKRQSATKENAVQFLDSLGHKFTPTEILKVQSAYKGMDSMYYLSFNDLLNEGAVLHNLNPYGLTKTGHEARRQKAIRKEEFKKMYRAAEAPHDRELTD
jgi:hypothetical protein